MSPNHLPEVDLTPVAGSRRIHGYRVLFLLLLGTFLVLSGCGKKAPEDPVLAKVGSKEIVSSYYEGRLALMEETELPMGEDGLPLDMASMEGKQEFLNTLINKEVMVLTCSRLGIDQEPRIVNAREAVHSYEARMEMYRSEVDTPSREVSDEEVAVFYENMNRGRKCGFLLTNFEKEAEAARAMAEGGADWLEVVAKYHEGGEDPSGKYEITVPYGRYKPEFEDAVFQTEVGHATPPVLTANGYWLLQVREEITGRKPPLDEALVEIVQVTQNRKLAYAKEEFQNSVRDKYQFKVDEDALWIAYQGLPEEETLMDPATNEPRKKDELRPLDVSYEELDRIFYSYVGPDGPVEYTVGDYKAVYDRMSVFQRPKHHEMMGGMRAKITQELDDTLFNFAAEDLGYFDDPDVLVKVNTKIEEMMVSILYTETVKINESVTAEDIDTFWEANSDRYRVAESRTGRLVICRSQEDAESARNMVLNGQAWKKVLAKFGSNEENKASSGKVTNQANDRGPIKEALFSLELDEVSPPIDGGDGTFAVVRLEMMEPGRPMTKAEATDYIGKSIRDRRAEELFNGNLEEWKSNYEIQIFPEELAEVQSWQELTTVQIEGELLNPR